MKTCKDCAFWENYNDYHGQIEEPIDPDTYRPMDIGFDVKACKSDNITIFERNPNRDGVSLTDGSQYYARMFTGPDYGCVNFKETTNGN